MSSSARRNLRRCGRLRAATPPRSSGPGGMITARACADDGVGGRILANQEQRGGDHIDRVEQLNACGNRSSVMRVPATGLSVLTRMLYLHLRAPASWSGPRGPVGRAVFACRNCRTARCCWRSSGCGRKPARASSPNGLGGEGAAVRWTLSTNSKSAAPIWRKSCRAAHPHVDEHVNAAHLSFAAATIASNMLELGDRMRIGHACPPRPRSPRPPSAPHHGAGAIARSAKSLTLLPRRDGQLKLIFAANPRRHRDDDGDLVLKSMVMKAP